MRALSRAVEANGVSGDTVRSIDQIRRRWKRTF